MVGWESLGYALACVLLPVIWGVAVVWVSNRIERKILGPRGDAPQATAPPVLPIEYHI